MNKNRHGTFLVLERELFSLKKISKKNSVFFLEKITPRHGTAVNLRHDGTCRTASLLSLSGLVFLRRYMLT